MAEKKKRTALKVPKLTDEEIEQLRSDNEVLRELSALALINKSLPQLPNDYVFKMRDRRTVELVHHAAFELVGGVPAFAMWGSQNPTEFYKLYARLLPEEKTAQANTQINIVSALGKNPLDSVSVNTEIGQVIDIDTTKDSDADEY